MGESARRGPRCARRLSVYMGAAAGASSSTVSIRVLQGGADQWIRRFFNDPSRVEGFDDDYWGFFFSEEEGGPNGGGNARGAEKLHSLYSRPADQPATPWSAAGAKAASSETAADE